MTNIQSYKSIDRATQKAALEALIFASSEPLPIEEIYKILLNPSNSLKRKESSEEIIGEEETQEAMEIDFAAMIDEINTELEQTGRPFQIIKTGGGYLYSTNPIYGEILQNLSRYKIKKRLSQAALESLAIIAYKQPISKPEIEQVRGVNSNEVVNSLIEKNLVQIVGRRDVMGKPLLYGTTNDFLVAFGINSLEELPRIREIDDILNDEEERKKDIVLDVTQQTEELISQQLPIVDEVSISKDNIEFVDNFRV